MSGMVVFQFWGNFSHLQKGVEFLLGNLEMVSVVSSCKEAYLV